MFLVMCEKIVGVDAIASEIYFAFRGLSLSLLGRKPLPVGSCPGKG